MKLQSLSCFAGAALLALAASVNAIDFRIHLATNQFLTDTAFLHSFSPIVLRRIPEGNAGDESATNKTSTVPKVMKTLAKRDGSAVFSNVPAGAWLLEFQLPYLIFNQYRVDIPDADAISPPPVIGEGITWKGQPAVRVHLRGQSLASTLLAPVLPYPLVVAPIAKQEFYTEPEKFNIKALLANPMILMGGVGMLLIFVVPKLQAQLDPEAQAEMRASQAAMQKKMAAFQSGDIGALFREDPPPPPAPRRAVEGGSGGSAAGVQADSGSGQPRRR
ncbi:hypothetical protein OC846_003062 [Tilletia horrida]|uniref:ER membrane protein complex subunit 7 beta-sandwich domain-containing protein n=1 Tax=Tilletia horrida TaxID=155126 RepID=A0AAN6GSU0_9BASI|nr:hypothetical protein OC845_002824 [Tilletia horrida]KAK0551978.1 hypothetical protein OC846_003062 [Tilletia horrida]KAK0566177.1 hypothetical protein OC861_003398 [Tilletia horrida]